MHVFGRYKGYAITDLYADSLLCMHYDGKVGRHKMYMYIFFFDICACSSGFCVDL